MERELVPLTANDYLSLIIKRWYVVAIPMVLAVAAAFVLDGRAADSFDARAAVSIRTGVLASPFGLVSDGDALATQAVAVQTEVIKGPAVRERAESIDPSLGSFPSPTVVQVGRSDWVSIGIVDDDPERAAAVANAYAGAYLDHTRGYLDELGAELAARADGLGASPEPAEASGPFADLYVLRRTAIAEHLADLDLLAADDAVAAESVRLAEPPSAPVERDTNSKLAAAAIVGILAGLTLLFGVEMLRRGRVATDEPEAPDQRE